MLSGNVAEMATGEGKTLTAAIAAYGHVRLGNGPVHVITVNDYLARRDAEWMAPVYELLGLTVGLGRPRRRTPEERREAYASDVTYVSVSEAGFDYLRDQLVTDVADRVQRRLATAIVDEADSILIDEARVPMVLAGSVADEQDPVHAAAALVARPASAASDYEVADDGRSVALTADGPGRGRGQARRHRPVRRRARRTALRGQRGPARARAAATATSTTSSATARSS